VENISNNEILIEKSEMFNIKNSILDFCERICNYEMMLKKYIPAGKLELVTDDGEDDPGSRGDQSEENAESPFVILEECGIETKGTWEDFSFLGVDGVVHTFDYGDCGFDSQKMPEVSVQEVQEITGIEVSRREKGGVYIWEIKVPQ
jgi:hypothetical protein